MKQINEIFHNESRPVKVIQFGEGNFLRAFVDYAVDVANEENGLNSQVSIIMPRARHTERFDNQDLLYTVCLRGMKDGKPYKENRVIRSVAQVLSAIDDYDAFMSLAQSGDLKFVVSNTTEAGIVFDESDCLEDCPPKTFPAKLTKFLYARYLYFTGATDKGLIMLPAELIDDNGQALQTCILKYAERWKLDEGFKRWVTKSCRFVDTLVDRIVTGFPKEETDNLWDELGYQDDLLVKAEPFSLWVIGDPTLSKVLSLHTEKFNVVFTKDVKAYKERKVRILNGAHTSLAMGAYLKGMNYVGDCMKNPKIRKALDEEVFDEIVPTVHLPKEDAEAFAKAVYERFENPFVNHPLLSISLNSVSKWKSRILPTFHDSLAMTGRLPKWLTYSLAALLTFYRSTESGTNCLIGNRGSNTYEIHDDEDKLLFFKAHAAEPTEIYARTILSQKNFWGEDLTEIPGLLNQVIKDMSHE